MKFLLLMILATACGVSDSHLSSEDSNNTVAVLETGKYKLDVEIPVYASVDLKLTKIPSMASVFGPIILLEKFEDGTSSVKVCSQKDVNMGGTKVTYEKLKGAYNKVERKLHTNSFLIEMNGLKATGNVSGFKVSIKSNSKLTVDLKFFKNEDGSYYVKGTDKTF